MNVHDWPEQPPEMEYTPLSEKEQDVLNRMIEGQEVYVEVEEGGGGYHFGYHPNPEITSGDKRIQVKFPMEFTQPEGITVPVTHLDLKLKTRNHEKIAHTTEHTYFNGEPLGVTAGLQVDLIWDLMVDEISDEFQGDILPRIKGEKVASEEDYKEE